MLAVIFSFKASTQAQETYHVPGILETVEEIVNLERSREETLLNLSSRNQKVLANMPEVTQLHIDPQFLRSLLFHSPIQYLKLAGDDHCLFLSLIENRLIRSSSGEVEQIPIIYKSQEDNENYNALVERRDFIQYLYQTRCFQNRELNELFNRENLKGTLEGIELAVPKSEAECLDLHKTWQNNRFLPYLCRIPEAQKRIESSEQRLMNLADSERTSRRYYRQLIDTTERYLENVSSFQISYLANLCDHLFKPQLFCQHFLAEDIWTKILNNERPQYLMSFTCAQHLKKDHNALTRDDLTQCASFFNSENQLCHSLRSEGKSSFFPNQDCKNLSLSLNNSRLLPNYEDCPGQIDNEGLTNIHRLFNYYDQREVSSTPLTCASETAYSFISLFREMNRTPPWPLEICYANPVIDRQECRQYIPGHHHTSELAETRVVRDILRQITSTPDDLSCIMTPKSEYRPNRLEFQSGCHIVYDPQVCSYLNCEKTIYYNQNKITQLHYQGEPLFNYYPLVYTEQRESLVYILTEHFNLQETTIRNLTEFKNFLNNREKGIIHGIGCLEDLKPQSFRRRAFQECRPTPFIIDGYHDDGPDTLVTIRTAIDSLHHPNFISWHSLLNAINSYSQLHPNRVWTLHGLH